MRRVFLSIAACVVVTSLASAPALAQAGPGLQPLLSNAAPRPPTPAATAIRDRIVVAFEDDAEASARQDSRADAGTTVVRSLGRAAHQLLRPKPGQTVADAIAALRDDPDVQAIQRDFVLKPTAVPNDPLFGQQWGLRNVGIGINGAAAVAGDDIGVLGAWDYTVGIPGTVVADIDSGYRAEHPDLGPVSPGWDFVGNDADPTDDELVDGGHGMHTAGIIAASGNNGIGVSGVAQNVSLMPLRVCDDSGCATSRIVSAINFAGQHGARVANLSLGGPGTSPTIDQAMALYPGTLFVIAAGNGVPNSSDPSYGLGVNNDDAGNPYRSYPCVPSQPRTVNNVICVAATNQADQLASFSNYGHTTVDLSAPGTDILSTYPTFAAPLVADDFAGNDFGSRWPSASFSLTSESPLTSLGIANSPSSPVANAQAADSTRTATSTAFTVPATSTCTMSLDVTAAMAAGHVFAFGPVEGSTFDSVELDGPVSGSGNLQWDFTVPAGSTKVRVSYATGSAASAAGAGMHVDNVVFNCIAPVGQGKGYAFLDGTSMATPMVSGAAALLFSQVPSATVGQVRSAIVQNTDLVASLATKTVSGGRLDVGKAMNALLSTVTPQAAPPSVPAPAPATVTTPTTTVTKPQAVVRCVVPKLAGRTLAGATSLLKRARCRVGKVTKPHHGTRLRVKTTSPRAGTRRSANAKVAIALANTRKPKR